MSSTAIVGLQWGDEGKGKITDLLAQNSHYVVRYQGGNNAGHSIKIGDQSFILHLIPSGVIHQGKISILGAGMVIDPKSLLEELRELKEKQINISEIYIDQRAHLTFPYHRLIDQYKEETLGKASIGTTKKGIGPTYEDKIARIGIRVIDLLDERLLKEKIQINLKLKNEVITKIYKKPPLDLKEIIEEYIFYAHELKPRIINTLKLIHKAIKEKKNILFEGAQALLLDVNYGTYPYVTSSHPSTAGACIGAGIAPCSLKNLVGVAKAYTTRVGEGPFPTELKDEDGIKLQQVGHEYGATTGRKRRCGWIDLIALEHSIQINGINQLILTKLDVLSEFDSIKICVGYKNPQGELINEFPASTEQLYKMEPLYEVFSGWKKDISHIRDYKKLPENCKKYIRAIEERLQIKIKLLSVGPKRDQNIIRFHSFF